MRGQEISRAGKILGIIGLTLQILFILAYLLIIMLAIVNTEASPKGSIQVEKSVFGEYFNGHCMPKGDTVFYRGASPCFMIYNISWTKEGKDNPTDFDVDLIILDRFGDEVDIPDNLQAKDSFLLDIDNRTINGFTYTVTIPDIEPGKYVLELKVIDKNSRKRAWLYKEITVMPGRS